LSKQKKKELELEEKAGARQVETNKNFADGECERTNGQKRESRVKGPETRRAIKSTNSEQNAIYQWQKEFGAESRKHSFGQGEKLWKWKCEMRVNTRQRCV